MDLMNHIQFVTDHAIQLYFLDPFTSIIIFNNSNRDYRFWYSLYDTRIYAEYSDENSSMSLDSYL